jgi:hypothetical protein
MHILNTGNFQAKSIVLPLVDRPECHKIVIHVHQSVYRKQLLFFFYFFWMIDWDISWEYKLWSELVSSAKVRNTVCCCSSRVQDGFEEELNKDIAQELILDLPWHPHIWRWPFFTKWRWHSKGQEEWHRLQRQDWHCTVLTCCTCDTQVYTGVQWVEAKWGTPHEQRLTTTEHFHADFSWNYAAAFGRDKQILPLAFWHTWRMLLTAWCMCPYLLLCGWVMTKERHWKTAGPYKKSSLWPFKKQVEMRQFLSYTEISSF